ncbi:unnamed protein product [Effrenium voratum]|nr:unnamed protein product [Effrenium voratum]
MAAAKAPPNIASLNAAIGACASGQQWQYSLQLFAEATNHQRHDVISFNATISSVEKGRNWPLALHLLAQMPESELQPDVFSLTSVISACDKASRWQMALWFFSALPSFQVRPNTVTFNAAVSACRSWEKALQLFQEMPSCQIQPDRISFNATISALADGFAWPEALHLFGQVDRPNAVTFNATISACEKGSRWQPGVVSPPIKPDDSVGDEPLPALEEWPTKRCSYYDRSDGRDHPDTAFPPNRLLHEYGEARLAAFLKDVRRRPGNLTQAVREKRRDLGGKGSRSPSPARKVNTVESMLHTLWRQVS